MKAYQMKIMIKNSHPPIWRRCIVPAGLTFSQLSFLLNEIMGWFGSHLSMFEFYHLGIVLEDDPESLQWGNQEIMDAIDTPIEPFMDTENWFTYIYDLGDYWEHRVEIEKVLLEYEYDYPMVLKYKGDTPYEDCGGIDGYYEKVEILENPKDPRYKEIKEWLDALPHITYDPDEVNEILKKYPLSKKTHAPMSCIEIYESCWNGEPLYTIADVFDEKSERDEASLEEWKALYESASKIKELKPWERFWDMDIIALKTGHNIAFVSILGQGGTCYGICIYEGMDGLNDYMMLCQHKALNLSETYVGFSQNNLTCYWGNREELSDEQYQIIKSLGYKFRGKNQWLYFISHKTGYFPYNMDAAEVRRMNSYLSQLAKAIQYYDEKKFKVNFEQGNMFCYSLDERNGEWIGEEKPLPLTSYQFMHLEITSEKFIKDFCETPQDDCGLDIHIECLPFFIDDTEYERPGIVRMLMLADTDSGMILGTEILHPDEVEGEALVNYLVSLMFDSGRPREIRVCNDIIKHYIDSLCKVGNIKLRKVKKIPIFQKFIEGLKQIN